MNIRFFIFAVNDLSLIVQKEERKVSPAECGF